MVAPCSYRLMTEDRSGGEGPSQHERRSLGRLLLQAANQLLGGTETTDVNPQHGNAHPEKRVRSAAESAKLLEHALEQFESTLGRLEARGGNSDREPAPRYDDDRNLSRTLRRVEDALEQVVREARRISDEASRLTLIAERLEVRVDRPAEPEPDWPHRPAPPAPEPQFQPQDEPLRIVLAAVPGFQGLMDTQRALAGLEEVDGASVVAYRNGEATLEVALLDAISASDIVNVLTGAIGHELLIEESQPDDLRLRLRFVD